MRSRSPSRLAFIVMLASIIEVGALNLAAGSDFCITNIETMVGKGFHVPPRGKCKPWLGYTINGEGGPNSGTGTACTAADGSHVAITVTTMYPASADTIFTSITLPLPLGTGTPTFSETGLVAPTGYGLFRVSPTTTAGPCNPALPAP